MERLYGDFEVKSFDDDGTFSGYGSVFGVVDSHLDVVAKNAFTDTLAEHKAANTMPSLLLMHGMGSGGDDALPIGVWTGMTEDSVGLWCTGKLALGNKRADEAYRLMKMTPRPALTGLSIGYRATKFRIHGKHEPVRRTLNAVKLFEVSLVDSPSNGKARVQAVKRAGAIEGDRMSRAIAGLAEIWTVDAKRKYEEELRREGYSRSDAKRMVSERFQ